MVKYVQPPSKEKNTDLCSCVSLLASCRFSYVFGPLFTSNNYPEKKQAVCFVDREYGFFDPVFLKISFVAGQKLVTFNSSNILKCKMLTHGGSYALSFSSLNNSVSSHYFALECSHIQISKYSHWISYIFESFPFTTASKLNSVFMQLNVKYKVKRLTFFTGNSKQIHFL